MFFFLNKFVDCACMYMSLANTTYLFEWDSSTAALCSLVSSFLTFHSSLVLLLFRKLAHENFSSSSDQHWFTQFRFNCKCLQNLITSFCVFFVFFFLSFLFVSWVVVYIWNWCREAASCGQGRWAPQESC